MRRFVEKNRLTLAWECVGVVQNDPYAATKVLQMIQKGWCVAGVAAVSPVARTAGTDPPDVCVCTRARRCVFEPSEDDPLNATVFRMCVHCSPTPVGEPRVISASPIDVGIVAEMVLSLYEKTVTYIFNAVVNSLLDS